MRRVSGIVVGVINDFNNDENAGAESCSIKIESLAIVSSQMNRAREYQNEMPTFVVYIEHVLIGIAKSKVIGDRRSLLLALGCASRRVGRKSFQKVLLGI